MNTSIPKILQTRTDFSCATCPKSRRHIVCHAQITGICRPETGRSVRNHWVFQSVIQHSYPYANWKPISSYNPLKTKTMRKSRDPRRCHDRKRTLEKSRCPGSLLACLFVTYGCASFRWTQNSLLNRHRTRHSRLPSRTAKRTYSVLN